MVDEFISKVLIDLGVQKEIIENPTAYELLKEKILIEMLRYRRFALDRKEKDLVAWYNNYKLEQSRVEWMSRGNITKKEAEENVLIQRYEQLNESDYYKFLEYLTNDKDKNHYKVYGEITIKLDNDKIFIIDRLPDSSEINVITRKPNSNNIAIGTRKLLSVQDFNTGIIKKEYLMTTGIIIYDKSGKIISGNRKTYIIDDKNPIKIEKYNPETDKFEELTQEQILKETIPTNISNAKKDGIIYIKKAKKLMKKSISKRKNSQRITKRKSKFKGRILRKKNKKRALYEISHPDFSGIDIEN